LTTYLQPFTAISLDACIAELRRKKIVSHSGVAFASLPGVDYFPLPFDAFANTDTEGIDFLKKLTTHHFRRSGYSFDSGFKFNMDTIRCTILRATARMFIARYSINDFNH